LITHPDRHKTKIKRKGGYSRQSKCKTTIGVGIFPEESMEDHELKAYEIITIILMLIAFGLILAS